MKAMTVVAAAVLAAGIYHYRRYRAPKRAAPRLRVPDDLLAERVHRAVAGAASTPVDVRVANGIVTLRGKVKSAERDLVLAAALAVPEVSRVANQLEVEGAAAEAAGAEHGPTKGGFAGGR